MKAQAYTPPPTPRFVWTAGRRRQTGAVVAALAVSSAFFGWLHSRRQAPQLPSFPAVPRDLARSAGELALPMPAAPARAPSFEAASAVSLPAMRPAIAAAAPAVGVDRGAMTALRPAWTKAPLAQSWSWPRKMAGFDSGALKAGNGKAAAAPARLPTSRLSGWFPANPRGRQLQFSILSEDGEKKVFEDEYPAAFRAAVRAAAPAAAPAPALAGQVAAPVDMIKLAKEHHEAAMPSLLKSKKGAVSVRDVSPEGQMVGNFEITYADGRKETVTYDPLVFDLKGRGVQTSPRKVLFDLFGHHRDDRVQWMNDIDEGTGILVFDADGKGGAGRSGSEIFGDRTDLSGVGRPDGFANGFEALRGLVDKAVKQGVLPRRVLESDLLETADLASLGKAYGLGVKVGGFNARVISLAEAGIQQIALSREPVRRVENFDGSRNDLVAQPGAVFLRADGSTGAYMNIWLVAKTGNLGLSL
jgi:hypothetical protein